MIRWPIHLRNAIGAGTTEKAEARGQEARRHARANTGFTIIELLVSLAVMSIILSILLPVLGTTKKRVKLTRRLSYHRQFITGFYMYATDYGGLFPYLSDPQDPDNPHFVVHGWELVGGDSHFGRAMQFWPSVIVPNYLDWHVQRATDDLSEQALYSQERDPGELPIARYVGPGRPLTPNPFIFTFFIQTKATVAAPAYFVPAPERPGNRVQLLQPQRLADVRYPSNKGLLRDFALGVSPLDMGPGIPQQIGAATVDLGRISVGMMDGSAAFRPMRLVDGGRKIHVLWTPHGIYGRDF